MPNTRIPTQERSIKKKNLIIETGFNMMCDKGFYNVTTSDIAKEAKVSTGIIYQYFNDKKEIFIEGIKNYSNNILFPLIDVLESKEIDKNNIDELIKKIIDKFIENHNMTKKAHEELIAMSHIDDEISEIFRHQDMECTNKIVSIFEKNNIYLENAKEKIHIIYGLIDNLCHEIVYHKHQEIDYDIMKKEVINIILATLK